MPSKNIYVVDDDDLINSLVESFVIELGHQAKCFNSGYEAMSSMENDQVDLVICDYRMKNGDGVSLAHYCTNKNIPSLILSGFSPEEIQPYLPKGVLAVYKSDITTVEDFAKLLEKYL